MRENVVISIVTYNSGDIFEVLDNLEKELANTTDYQVHIYDNGSEADYLKKIKQYEFVKVIAATNNLGFGHGHNQILLNSPEKYGIIFNPDILVKKVAMDRMLDLIQSDDSLATVSPKVLNSDGSTQHLVRQKLDVFDYMLRFIPFQFVKKLFAKRLAIYECRDLSNDHTSYIKMGSGCFLVVDIDKFKEIGGFDEQFFMYFEDNDLCLRFGQAGYKLLYTPFETVVHLYGKGAHRSKKLFKVFMQSMKKFFDKWGWRFF